MGSRSLRSLGSRALVTTLVGVALAFAGLGSVTPAGAVPVASDGVVVDASGGLHVVSYGASPVISSFTSVDTWSWDIARGVALRAADPTSCAPFGGYTLDGWGGLHPFGINGKNPPARPVDGPYWRGWDIARDVALVPADPRVLDSPPAGGFVLDGFGGLHYFTIDPSIPKPVITGGPYWNGWDIARGLVILTTPGTSGGYRGGYVVDAWGGLHAFSINGTAPDPVDVATAPYWKGWDIVQGATALPGSGTNGGLIQDGWGGLHPFTLGSGPAPDPAQLHGGIYTPGWNLVRGIAMRQRKAGC